MSDKRTGKKAKAVQGPKMPVDALLPIPPDPAKAKKHQK